MARQITLNDQEWIEIVNSKKQVTGGFWWNPSDIDIVKRCEKTIDFFNNVSIPEGDKEALFKLSEQVKQQFNFLLNSENAADTLFERSNPFSPREDGTLYAEYVLNTLTKFIESEFNVRMKKTTSRIKKYTEKYEES